MRLAVLALAFVLGTTGAATAQARSTATAPRARVAQVQTAVERAAAAVVKAEGARAQLVTERARLARRYESELAEIDKLKRQKASWRRDRALRGKLAASFETARALETLAGKLKRADADVVRARAAAVVSVDQALITASGPARADLERKRRAWAPAPPPPRKIIIPDEALDPLADPEELEERAAELRDVEAELGREIARLEQQATRYDRMAQLRKQHERAAELAVRDESDPRRIGTTARGGAFESNDAVADGAGAPPNQEDSPGTGGGLSGGDPSGDSRDFATALTDVVDPSTVDALRRAERSTDPSARAAAARRARDAVNQRLATMRKKRAAIEGRARELRTQ
jgi:phage shock protein A